MNCLENPKKSVIFVVEIETDMKYEILQLDRDNINVQCDALMFMPWSYVNEKYGFNHWNYKKVYEGEIDGEGKTTWEILDRLFTKFNNFRPNDFKGHSLSTSDVVILDGVWYYCDSFGWVDVKNDKKL